ncbi:MAG TPA: ribonucleoside-diphosphate reductase subunit alpha [bacterium]|nr:ribonucleoside-diphosphate reductase subunit alpha [bacterium]
MNLTITKRDGSREPFDADRINRAIERACYGLTNPIAKITQIASETQLTLYDGITTTEMDQAVINTTVQNIQEDIEFDRVAVRLRLKTVYKKILGDYETADEIREIHRNRFRNFIESGVEQALLDPKLKEIFDLELLAQALDIDRDELLTYTGLGTMSKRYLLRDRNHDLMETPQYFWMRIAMGLALTEKNPTEIALRFYAKMSALEYIPGGSTNIAAGTNSPRLSNCYLLDMEDDIENIGKTISDIMRLSKATGGIGLAVTKLRANGSPIATNNTFSSGPIPFLHIIDSTIRAISRAGKKMGALCFYMENWHIDFGEFLDLKQNAGDEYRRTRTANTAVYISDEFMKRVKNRDWWYLFDPKDAPLLIESYGAEFSRNYAEYIVKAERGEIKRFKKIKAEEQLRAIIVSLQTTSHPWLTWKDTINVRALNNNTGIIHCSNLCTEITLPEDRENVAVCNLLSINLARHIKEGRVDWKKLAESSRLGIRQLDNLVDINKPPIPEAENFDSHNRALGMGYMGFADMLEQLGLPYGSKEAFEMADRISEFISYHAIDESANLAQEKGSYSNFSGSGWSKGYVPVDTITHLAENRQEKITVEQGIYSLELDWNKLREKVKNGMRNATLLAIAPTANIGLVAGTSPGIDPRFAQMFSRNTLSGKYLEINFNLVRDLKRLGLWERCKSEILANYGDLTHIEGIPEHLKEVYKTSFSISPHAFIEVAARAQKWVDQALSRNMYLETRDTEEIMKVYIAAWEKGLKTTYYLHMKPRHSAEQSTVKINKASSIGKRGFGVLFNQLAAEPVSLGIPITVETPAPTTFSMPTPEPVRAVPEINIGFSSVSNQEIKPTQSFLLSQYQTENIVPIMKSEGIAQVGKTCPIDPMERLMCDSCQ